MADQKLTLPTIHLNGTARSDLQEQAGGAMDALRTAMEGLRRMAPNGRDYYPQGNDAITNATRQHQSRMERVGSVMAELEAIQEHLYAEN